MDKDFILQIEDLHVQFKDGRKVTQVLNGVNLSVRRNRTLCIVGESGCGKSMTAHSVMQLLPKTGHITGGKILYNPEREHLVDLASYPNKKMRNIRGQEIAMIFQDPMSSLNPVYTIGSQIMENLCNHEKMPKAEARKRIIRLLADLGIADPERRFDEYPHQFSGGMKQRVMIAIAMICNPNLLIADEPTTALDVTIQAQIIDLLRRIQDEHGTSIMMITHNMGIVAEIADDVAVMYMGKVVEFGTLEQIFTNPKHPYTRALMRSVPTLGLPRGVELESIEGSTPGADTVFTGCEFCDRCTCARTECASRFPVETEVEPGHKVRCLLYEEENA